MGASLLPLAKSIYYNIYIERERRLGTRQVCQNGLVNFVATHDET